MTGVGSRRCASGPHPRLCIESIVCRPIRLTPLCPYAWASGRKPNPTLCLNPVRDEHGLQAGHRQLPHSVQLRQRESHRCRSKQGNDSLPWEKAPRVAHPAEVPAEAEGCLSRGLPEESCYLSRPKVEESLLMPQESAQLSSVLVPEWLYLGWVPGSSSWGLARESSYWE